MALDRMSPTVTALLARLGETSIEAVYRAGGDDADAPRTALGFVSTRLAALLAELDFSIGRAARHLAEAAQRAADAQTKLAEGFSVDPGWLMQSAERFRAETDAQTATIREFHTLAAIWLSLLGRDPKDAA